jgi:two-component system, NarL family, invasion response regulator UvrY
VKILIVDDHPIVRAGLRRLLMAEPEVEVQEAASGRAALKSFKEQQPGLVVLDMKLPDIGGLEVLARLKAIDPDVRVLVLSMHDDETHVTRALRAGAAGYVTKTAPPEELVEAIRRIAVGRTYIEREIAEGLIFATIRGAPDPLRDLSSRDIEILRQLAAGRTLSEIAHMVGIGYKTAANTCSRIKTKLGVASTADLIRIAILCGLVDRDAPVSARPPDQLLS